jgi:hypothetical protein
LNVFKNYAVCFDCIFELGLDLSKPLPKPIPRNSRIYLDSHKNTIVEKVLVNPYDLFQLFISIKQVYESNYCTLSKNMDILV